MATRLNKKFILILTGVILILGVGVAGVAYVAISGDAERQVRLGEEAEAKGDLSTALDRYGRAISKDPMNLAYYGDFERVLLKTVPKSRVDARERYTQFLAILNRRKNASVDNPASWDRLISEYRRRAVLLGASGGGDPWMEIQDQSERMADQFEGMNDAESVEATERANGYLMNAMANRLELLKPKELLEFEDLGRRMVESGSTDPRVWEALLRQRIGAAKRYKAKGDTRLLMNEIEGPKGFDALYQEMDDRGVEMSPELYEMRVERFRLDDDREATEEAFQIVYDEFRAEMAAIVEKIRTLEDEEQIPVQSDILRRMVLANILGANDIIEVMAPLLEEKKLSLDLAMVLYQNLAQSSPEYAELAARYTLEAERLPVGLIAMMQPVARQQAALSIFDSMYSKVVADSAEGGGEYTIVDLKIAREEALTEFVGDPSLEEVKLYLDGSIALMEEDYINARSKLSEVSSSPFVRTAIMQRRFIPRLVAASMMSGERGVAIKELQEYADSLPAEAVVGIRAALARELLAVGRFDDAQAEVQKVLASDPDNEEGVALLAQLNKQEKDIAENAAGTNSPESRAYARAMAAINERRIEDARVVLLEATRSYSDEIFIRMLISVEALLGNKEAALALISSLDGAEDDPAMQSMIMRLEIDDPIERVNQIADVSSNDEETRLGLRYLYLQELAQSDQPGWEQAREELAAAREKAIANFPESRALRQRVLVATVMDDIEAGTLNTPDSILDKAMAEFEAIETDEVHVLNTKARIATSTGDSGAALEILLPLTERGLDNADTWFTRGMAYAELGRTQESVDSYANAVDRAPDSWRYILAYTEALEKAGNQEQALKVLRNARKSPGIALLVRDAWLAAESSFGDQRSALSQRLSIYETDLSDANSGSRVINVANALELARLLVVVPVERGDIRDATGKALYSETVWGNMKSSGRRTLISRERAARKKFAFEVIDEVMKEAASEDERISIRLVLAQAHLLADQKEKAREEIYSIIECCDDQLDVNQRYRMVDLLGSFADDDAVLAQINRIAESEDLNILRNLALMSGRMGLLDLALEVSSRVAEQTGDSVDLMLKARSLVAMSDGVAAEKIVDQLLADPIILGDKETHYQSLLIDGTVQGLQGEIAVEQAIRLEKDIAVFTNDGDTAGAAEASARIKELIAETTSRFNRGIASVEAASELFPGRIMPRLRRHELLRAKVLLLRDAAIEAEMLENGRAVRELSPADWRTNKCLMEAHVVMGNPREAMSVIDQYFKNGGMSPEARSTLVGIARLEGKTGLAIPALQRAMDRDPSDPEWPRAIAKMLVESGSLDAASDMWWKVIEIETSDAAIESFIELEFDTEDLNIERVSEAFKLRPDIVNQMPNLKAAYAALLYRSGDVRRAEREYARAYTDAIQATRSDVDPLVIDKVLAYYTDVYPNDTLDQAEARIGAMSGGELGPHEYNALSLMADGESFEELDMESAIKYLRLARDKSAEGTLYRRVVLDRLARHLYMDNDCEGAVEALKEIVNTGKPAASTLNNLAYMMYDCLGDSAGAIFYSTQALQAAPASPEYLDTQGVILFDLGRLEEAELYLSRAVSIRATPSNLLHYAQLMHETDRDAEAQILLEKIGKDFTGLAPKLQAEVNELISKIK